MRSHLSFDSRRHLLMSYSLYDDLFDLVCFLPTLYHPVRPTSQLPTGANSPAAKTQQSGEFQPLVLGGENRESMEMGTLTLQTTSPLSYQLGNNMSQKPTLSIRPNLRPGRDPPSSSVWECFPIRNFLSTERRLEIERRRMLRKIVMSGRALEGVRPDIAIEISRIMYSWVESIDRRKAVSDETRGRLMFALEKMDEGLAKMEKIVSTPIPFSYTAHIWVVAWLYCLLLPFQLCHINADFSWSCIPAVMVSDGDPI